MLKDINIKRLAALGFATLTVSSFTGCEFFNKLGKSLSGGETLGEGSSSSQTSSDNNAPQAYTAGEYDRQDVDNVDFIIENITEFLNDARSKGLDMTAETALYYWIVNNPSINPQTIIDLGLENQSVSTILEKVNQSWDAISVDAKTMEADTRIRYELLFAKEADQDALKEFSSFVADYGTAVVGNDMNSRSNLENGTVEWLNNQYPDWKDNSDLSPAATYMIMALTRGYNDVADFLSAADIMHFYGEQQGYCQDSNLPDPYIPLRTNILEAIRSSVDEKMEKVLLLSKDIEPKDRVNVQTIIDEINKGVNVALEDNPDSKERQLLADPMPTQSQSYTQPATKQPIVIPNENQKAEDQKKNETQKEYEARKRREDKAKLDRENEKKEAELERKAKNAYKDGQSDGYNDRNRHDNYNTSAERNAYNEGYDNGRDQRIAEKKLASSIESSSMDPNYWQDENGVWHDKREPISSSGIGNIEDVPGSSSSDSSSASKSENPSSEDGTITDIEDVPYQKTSAEEKQDLLALKADLDLYKSIAQPLKKQGIIVVFSKPKTLQQIRQLKGRAI